VTDRSLPPEGLEPPSQPVGLTLLDGVTPQVTDPMPLDAGRRLAADRDQELDVRLAAYEDLLESEVGDTTLTRARNIEREAGMRQLYLKFEGSNPTGTQKDRIAFAQALDALRLGYDAVTVATCGNYGVATALAAAAAGLRCIVYMPEQYHSARVKEMERWGVELVRQPGDYEAAVDASQIRAERDEIYDANPGGANTLIQLRAYGEIAYEIYDELRDAPAAVAVPVSNGTTLAGIHHGFVSLYRRGKTSRIPRFIGGSSHGKNPVIHAWRRKLTTCENLDPQLIKESRVNEPLINWHSIDGDLALEAIQSTDGWADECSDRAMTSAARDLREREGLSVLPASTAGLLALLGRHQQQPLPGDRYVAILTGRR